MISTSAPLCTLLSALSFLQGAPADPPPRPVSAPSGGGVVAVGGGKMPDRIYRRMLELTGKPQPKVLILPLATSEPEKSGPAVDLRFRENGAQNVEWKFFTRKDAPSAEVAAAIGKCDVLFFPGGDQKKILEVLRGTPAQAAVSEVLRRGGVVGGTSAGCEVLGDLSLTGSGNTRTDLAVQGATEVEPGLSLIPGVVFDQHFLKRSRFLRLLGATLDSGRHVGIGVDESTAVVLPHGTRQIEVIGERQVTVVRLDEESSRAPAEPGDLARASGVRLHLLTEGDRYDIDLDRVHFAPTAMRAPARAEERAAEAESGSASAPAAKTRAQR